MLSVLLLLPPSSPGGDRGAAISRDEDGKLQSVDPPASEQGLQRAGENAQTETAKSGVANPSVRDRDRDGVTVGGGDCDDSDPTVHPGAPETCDGKDQDCDGTADDNPTDSWIGQACCPTGDLADCTGLGDCRPGSYVCHEGQKVCAFAIAKSPEVCDHRDNDCDGVLNDDVPCPAGTACEDVSTGFPPACVSPCDPNSEFPCPGGYVCLFADRLGGDRHFCYPLP